MYGGDCEVMQQSSTPASMMMMLTGGTSSTAGMSLSGGGGGMAAGMNGGGGGGMNLAGMSMNNMGMSGLGLAGMGMATAGNMAGMGLTSADLLFSPSPPHGLHMGMMNQLSSNVNGGFVSSTFHHGMVGVSGSLGLQPVIPKEEAGMLHSRVEEELDSGGSGASGQLDGLSCGEEQETTDHSLYSSQQQQAQQLMMMQQDEQQQQQQDGLNPQQGQKKKRYHRHTARQIQEMEALFKECQHPDDKQRMRLSQELGLKPRQVKFWFQNRRTQMKAQQDRSDNVILRAENESLKNDNFRLQSAIRNVVCPNCGGPAILGEMSLDEQHLRLENARLKEELDRLSCIATRYGGRAPPPGMGPAPPLLLMPHSLDLDMGIYSRHFQEQSLLPPQHSSHNHTGSADMSIPLHATSNNSCQFLHQQQQHPQAAPFDFILVPDHHRQVVLELAAAAAEQLVTMCRTNEPLWRRSSYGTTTGASGGSGGEVLVVEEHARMFQTVATTGDRAATRRIEGTRDRGHAMMNSVNLVDAFFDVNKYTQLFPSIVSNAKTLQVISSSPSPSGSGNGSLHLMYAELLALSPLVPAREAYFFRYCQHNSEEGYWLVVDLPANSYAAAAGDGDGIQIPSTGYNRKPSGCVFQDMPNGYSMITWVELADLEDKGPLHPIFNDFVRRGAAFGATRWLSVLQQQCDRLASAMARTVSDPGVIPSPEARKNLMCLSQRMIRTFCSSISLQLQGHQQHQPWTALSDSSNDAVRINTRKNTDAGQPSGVILTAVSTTWLPHSHLQVFELLTDESKRVHLDVLSNGNSLHEVAHIANGSHHKNCVSLFRVNSSSNSSQNVELMLQESHTHPTGGSMVVYATMDVDAVQVAMSGEDPSYIPLLPIGFVVFPASSQPMQTADANLIGTETISTELHQSYSAQRTTEGAGSLLTVGVQVLASAVPSAKINLSSVTGINNHLCNAVNQITAALGPATGGSGVKASSSPQSVIQASAAGTSGSTADP